MARKTSKDKSKEQPVGALARYFEAKLAAEWGPHDLKRRWEADPKSVVILDVRDRDSYEKEHIKGAVNIPLPDLESRLKELPRNKDLVTYCWSITCSLAPRAALILAKEGFRVHELVGGIGEWKQYNMPVVLGASRKPATEPALTN